jgi:hypothetical protein
MAATDGVLPSLPKEFIDYKKSRRGIQPSVSHVAYETCFNSVSGPTILWIEVLVNRGLLVAFPYKKIKK